MSTLSRFHLTAEDLAKPAKPLPPLPPSASSIEAELQQLAADICQFDPQLAEIAFSLSFSTKSRDERLAQIEDWARA